MISRGSSTFPRDLLIFRPCLSRTMEWRSTWRHAGGQQKGLGTGGRPGMWALEYITLLNGSCPVSWVPSMTMRLTQNTRRSLPVSKSERG